MHVLPDAERHRCTVRGRRNPRQSHDSATYNLPHGRAGFPVPHTRQLQKLKSSEHPLLLLHSSLRRRIHLPTPPRLRQLPNLLIPPHRLRGQHPRHGSRHRDRRRSRRRRAGRRPRRNTPGKSQPRRRRTNQRHRTHLRRTLPNSHSLPSKPPNSPAARSKSAAGCSPASESSHPSS